MEGVEILAEKAVYFYKLDWLLSLVVFTVIFTIGLIASIHDNEAIFLIFGFIIGVVCGFLTLYFTATPEEIDYIEYKVTVSESVSLSEFTDKYSIINQEGKIFTIKEKIEDGSNSLSTP